MAEFKLGRLRFVWQGPWVTGITYVKDDIVKYGGTAYVCTSGHIANANFNVDLIANRWQLMAGGQSWVTNPWGTSTTYKLNDLVKYGGNVYICTLNHTSSASTNGGFYTDETAGKWDLFVPGNDWKGNWLPNTYYKENDLVKYNGKTYICLTAHPSIIGSYLGESLEDVNIVNPGTGYTTGYALTISAPDLPGGVQAEGTITVGGASDSITSITISEAGSGYLTIPTITVVGDGNNAVLVGVISNSFVNGLETDQEKWQVFSEGFQWRGEWNGSETPGSRVATSYALNDVVKFGGSLYLCTIAHTSNASAFEEGKWATFTKGFEFESVWSAVTEYQQGDVVSYGGYVYVASARNSAQIPPTSAGFWELLTTGFNNRNTYISSQSYKVGDLIQYGGNTFVANSEVGSNETPYSASAKWSKLIDGFRWLADWSDAPTESTYKIGDVVKYLASTFLCINEHIPSEENTTVTATATNSTGNALNVGSTAKLNPLQPITFTGTGFGNLTNGVTYYVKAILNSNEITISATQNGTTKTLTTASGVMTGTFTSQPNLDDGTFWDSFVEGDANNVLIRRGDMVTRNAIQNVRLAKGPTGSFLKAGEQDLTWGRVGQITRIFYVSTDGIDAADRGTTLNDPWRTVKYACDFLRTQVIPTVDTPAVINVKTGVYTEVFPISIPKYCSLVGDELRMSIIQPTAETSGNDKFYMRDSTTMRNFTFRGATGANLPNGTTDTYTIANQYGTMRPTGGAWVSLDPGTGPNDESVWVGQRSPYMQNITLFGDYCIGQKIDGSLHNGGNRSLTSNDFTTILSNGIGAWAIGDGRAELVSVFTYYGYMGYLCENGGVLRATNGNNSYGTYGSVSEGVNPSEISRTASVDNRRLNALVDRVQTDGANQIIYLEYLNAGETYTTATFGFEGSGTIGSIVSTPLIRNGGVAEVRILNDGENYTSVTNNAQAGTYYGIRLSASDIQLSNGYNGERIVIIDGSGSGQYAYITSFDGGSKEALLGVDSFTPLTITNTTTSTNRVTVSSTATLSVDMPFSITGTGFGNLAQGTQYFVKALIGGGTQFTVYTNPDTKAETALTTASGTCLLHKSGWDVVVTGITETITGASKTNPVEITTSVPHAYYDGMQVTISSVTGMTQLNGNIYYVTKTGASTFTLYSDKVRETSVDGTGYTTYISGGTATGQQTILDFLNTTTRYVIEPRVVVSTGSGASATAVSTPGINTITVSGSGTQGGGGFTIPPEVIISGDGTATGGFGAIATTTISGSVDAIIIQDKGAGYVSTPTLTFVGGGLANNSPNHATADATITSTIKDVAVTAGGSGFTSPPSVVVTGTGGSGAIIAAQISNVIGSVVMSGGTNSGGSGYTSAPTVEFIGGEPLVFAEGTAVLSGSVTGVTIQEGGSGYDPSTTTVQLIGGQSGAGVIATADVVIDNGSFVLGVTPGIVTSIVMDVNGTLYFEPPTVVISSPTGVDASATASITGSVASVTLTNPGRGYQTTPTIVFAGGAGAGAQGTVTLTGSVINLTVVDGGRGWVGTPTLSFSGGSGSSATASVIKMDNVIDQITITSPGTGYTSNPAISITGGIFTYDEDKCSRDVGLMLDAVTGDMVFGSNYQTVKAGISYLRSYSSVVTGSQKVQTLAAIEEVRDTTLTYTTNATAVSRITTLFDTIYDIVDAGLSSVPAISYPDPTDTAIGITQAGDILQANRTFIRAEIVAWINAQITAGGGVWSGFTYDSATCSRDVGYIVDALTYDLVYGGNSQTVDISLSYYYGGSLVAEGPQSVLAYGRLNDIVQDIVQNISITKTPANASTQDTSITPAGSVGAASLLDDLVLTLIDIVDNGEGAAPAIVLPTYSNGNDILNLVRADIATYRPTIQTTIINWINTTYPTSRALLRSRIDGQVQTVTVTDPGGSFLVTPLITFANGNNIKSLVAGSRYYASASARIAIGLSQQTQTLAGIDRLRLVARAVVNNQNPAAVYQTAISRTTGSAGPTGIQAAVDVWARSVYYTIQNGENFVNAKSLMLANKTFIREEAMAFWSANYPGIATADWSNYVALMLDAVAEDIGFRGLTYSTIAGMKQIFLGTARTTDLATAVDGISFVRDLVLDIVQNDIVTAPLTAFTATATTSGTNYITVSSVSTIAVGDSIIFIGTGFGGILTGTVYYVTEKISGGTNYITVSTTLGGTPITLFTSSGTLTVSKQFINDTLTLETGATTAVTNAFNYTADVISATVANSSTYVAAGSLLLANKQYIKAEVIAYINATYDDFDYNQTLCARDVGFICDAIAYDLVNAVDNNPTVTSATTGVVSSITVDSGGLGYSYGVTIALTGGTPSTTATAVPVLDTLTGAITSFTMTNKGRGYASAPTVGITPDNGSGAFVRAKVVGGNVNSVTVIRPGSNYDAGPHLTLVDPNNTADAQFLVRVANGVLDQPRFTSRGIGFTAADGLVDGDGYADIAQVGGFIYVDNLTNIPTPGANIQFDQSENFYKLVTVRDVQGPTGIIGARNIITENKAFVQYEIISYLNNFVYNSTKCTRDVGFIIEAAAADFTYSSNARLMALITQYRRGTYAPFEQQRIQTASAIEYLQTQLFDLLGETTNSLNSLALTLDFFIEWLRDDEFYSALPAISIPSTSYDVQDSSGKNLLLANEDFIVAQVLAWMDNNSKLDGRDDAIFGREILQTIRSVAYDLTYTGNSQVVEFASSYYVDSTLLIPGALSSNSTAKAQLLDALTYLKSVMSDIVVNNNVTVESGNTEVQAFPTPTGDGATQGRINTLMTAFNAIVDSGFASSGVSLVGSDFSAFTTTKRTSVLAAKSTLQADVISWIDSTFVNFTYDQDVCFRDTGLIVQAFADDIFGDVAKSVEAGQRYYAATAALVLSEQRPQTAAAIYQINYIIQLLIRNETYTRTQTDAFQVRFPSITNGDEAGPHLEELSRIVRRILTKGNQLNDIKQLLLDNKAYIQSEVVAFVTASYENLDYNVALCYRDVGLMIDAFSYDIYGGLSRAREAGLRYYQSASALRAITGDQLAPTLAAIDYIEEIVQAILNNSNPAIAFQEAEARTSSASIVYPVDSLFIDDKATTFFSTVVGVINGGPSSLPPGRYSARLQVSPQLSIATAPAHNTPIVLRSKYSQVRLTGHDFLNIGTGSKNDTNYPGIPLNAPNQNNEISEQGGGRCFYTSTDQDGNFRVGELFKVEQSTGIATLNADAFNLSGLNELSLGGVNLGGSGATINEFSTDATFFANSDSIVPTQKAIKTYIQSALGSGGGNIAVNAVTAGDVFITAKEIDTVGGLPLSLISNDGIVITSTESSTSTTTGALTIAGGLGIAENVFAGGNASFNGTLTVGSTGFIKIATGDTLQRPASASQGMMRFNTSTLQFEGYNGTQWSSVGGGNPWTAKTSAYTAVSNDRLLVSTAATPVTISLPASPALGDTIKIIDAAGTFDLNPLTINRNGQPIMGDAENMTVDSRNAALTLIYYNATYGWRLGD